jgi:uncharacterized protein YdaU (DUF1376 family)
MRKPRCATVNWNWQEFLFDVHVMAMDPLTLGMYVRCLGAAALSEEPGFIRGDQEAMRRLAGAAYDEWVARGRDVLERFRAVDGGFLHVRTRRDYEAQSQRLIGYSIAGSIAGKASAAKRAMKATSNESLTDRSTIVQPPSLRHSVIPKEETNTSAPPSAPLVAERVSRTPRRHKPEETERFVEFYDDIWPRKVGRDEALRAWVRASAVKGWDEDRLCESAARWAVFYEESGTEQQYIPHPATWLNQGRYKDQPSLGGKR